MQHEPLSQHITEETLHTWLDNELGRRESGVVGEHVQECRACAEQFDECRDLRTTVSQLLASFDSELAVTPRAARSARSKLTLNPRVTSPPIISHIVAFSRPMQFWPTARKYGSLAALTLIFVGTASLVMVQGYHALAGSISAVAKERPTGAILPPKHSVTVTGIVTTISGQGITGATVTVSGTNLHTVTDPSGQFKIRDVSKSTKSIEVRGPLGYGSHTEFINLSKSADPVVNVVLLAEALAMNPYLVTAEQPSQKTRSQTSLTSLEPFSSADPRMFQALRGAFSTAGDFRLEVVDWPVPGTNTSALFMLESEGTLIGRVRDKTADLRITLTRDGSVWRGSASETRNYKTRWRRVSVRESSCALHQRIT